MTHKPVTRLTQISLPEDCRILLAELALARTKLEHPPHAITKSGIIADAIRKLAELEGVGGAAAPGEAEVPTDAA
jgi:hypothetical protein